MSTTIERSALVMHPAERMFDLVNDVAAYPEFMDGCVGATVLTSSDREMVAQLVLRKAGVEQRFTTRNQLQRPQRITLALEEGPFTALDGVWQFTPLNDSACKVSLCLTFTFKNSAVAFAAGKLFTQVANNLVAALCKRADEEH
ncbi:MAG: type II toxin-antitoxin system RatA family toxin [Porticoccaceae bacterium]|nr:type II toxin-antitoxin system RatA family toxin [Porticoccaceae bacterium]